MTTTDYNTSKRQYTEVREIEGEDWERQRDGHIRTQREAMTARIRASDSEWMNEAALTAVENRHDGDWGKRGETDVFSDIMSGSVITWSTHSSVVHGGIYHIVVLENENRT